MDHYSRGETNRREPGEMPAVSNVILSYNMESKSVSTKPSVHGEAATDILPLLSVHPTMPLVLRSQRIEAPPAPQPLGWHQAQPTRLVCTMGRAQHCPSGSTFWQVCWHGAGARWCECSLLFLPPSCFYSVRPVSAPSPAWTGACAQRWFSIVRSKKTAAGRNGQTRHCETAI